MPYMQRKKKWCKRLGRAGENAAAAMLRYKGMEIIQRNCRTPRAELDIIARDGGTLVFVEVKTLYRRNLKRPSKFRPLDNLTISQRRRIRRGALYYMLMLGHARIRYRVDVVEVEYTRSGAGLIRHHFNAFGNDAVYFRK